MTSVCSGIELDGTPCKETATVIAIDDHSIRPMCDKCRATNFYGMPISSTEKARVFCLGFGHHQERHLSPGETLTVSPTNHRESFRWTRFRPLRLFIEVEFVSDLALASDLRVDALSINGVNCLPEPRNGNLFSELLKLPLISPTDQVTLTMTNISDHSVPFLAGLKGIGIEPNGQSITPVANS